MLKHYFQPGREAFRSALHAAMPKLLTGGSADEKLKAESAGRTGKREEELRGIIEKMTAKTWKKDKGRLLELLAPGK